MSEMSAIILIILTAGLIFLWVKFPIQEKKTEITIRHQFQRMADQHTKGNREIRRRPVRSIRREL